MSSTKRNPAKRAEAVRAWAQSMITSYGYRAWHRQQEHELRVMLNANKRKK